MYLIVCSFVKTLTRQASHTQLLKSNTEQATQLKSYRPGRHFVRPLDPTLISDPCANELAFRLFVSTLAEKHLV